MKITANLNIIIWRILRVLGPKNWSNSCINVSNCTSLCIFLYHLRLFTIRKNILNLKNYGGFIFQNNEKYAIFEEKGDF